MSDTAKYSDGLLTSDEFIEIANRNNNENLKLQQDQAKKVFESTYASLERQYNETATSAGVAKERNLVDADTAYKLNDVKYGAEAEAMGRMGLTGSGMGEYRQAEAYAQNRADRQASYAEYDRVMREAAYNRDQGKLDADIKYSDDVTQARIKHNETATAISEKELGYAEGERAAIDSSFSTFIDGINDGTMTIDEIKADSYWPKLSSEQQKAVNSAWTVKGFKNSIDNGTYKDEGTLTSSEEFSALTDSEKSSVKSYFASYHAGKCASAEAAISDYWTMALNGASEKDLIAAATAAGHYEALKDTDGWNALVDKTKETTTTTNIENAIADGATLEDVQKMDGWNELSETEQNAYKDMIEDRDESISGVVDYIIEGVNAVVDANGNPTINSLSALNSFLNSYADSAGNLLSKEMKEKVAAKWIQNNINKAEQGIENRTLTSEDIVSGIKGGKYGDEGVRIAIEYANSLLNDLSGNEADVVDVINVLDDISAFNGIIPTERWNSMQGILANAVKVEDNFKMSSDAKYGREPVKIGEKITDEQTLAALNRFKNANKATQFLRVGDKMYYRDGNTWSTVVKDMSRDIKMTPADLYQNNATGQLNKNNGIWELGGQPIQFRGVDANAYKILEENYSDKPTGWFVEINGRKYAKIFDESWVVITGVVEIK